MIILNERINYLSDNEIFNQRIRQCCQEFRMKLSMISPRDNDVEVILTGTVLEDGRFHLSELNWHKLFSNTNDNTLRSMIHGAYSEVAWNI